MLDAREAIVIKKAITNIAEEEEDREAVGQWLADIATSTGKLDIPQSRKASRHVLDVANDGYDGIIEKQRGSGLSR